MQTKPFQLILSIFIFCSGFLFCSDYSIVFVHIGKSLPIYVEDAIDQAALFNEESDIYLLGNLKAVSQLSKKYEKTNVSIVPIETLTKSKAHKQFIKKSKLSREFRDGHSNHASERFFYLADFAKKENIKHLFHLENDVMLYVDLQELFPLFKTLYSNIAATFDNDSRCIPGFIYFKDEQALEHLTNFMQKEAALDHNDMQAISCYRQYYNSEYIDHLPITVKNYELDYPMVSISGLKSNHKLKYQNHIELFKSLFDAAAFGQYLGGEDPRNGPNEVGFVNEDSLVNPRHFSYTWEADKKKRMVPYVQYKGEKYRLNNLHIHSKELCKFSSHASQRNNLMLNLNKLK
ncbi:MAG: hypothetical protein P0S95_03715 [Rhabdochlamydiaceae bacterium]|nr:hypothetical protein [Candidatus Amphrikana amoebophyrae]